MIVLQEHVVRRDEDFKKLTDLVRDGWDIKTAWGHRNGGIVVHLVNK